MSEYTQLNTELVEKFGSLEKLCNEIYCTVHGVTNYIDDMTRCYDGRIYVSEWDHYIVKLKEIRHKRNQLSHGEVSFSEPYATYEDVAFTENFRNLILIQKDPLTIYRREKRAKNKTESVKATPSYENYFPQKSQYPIRNEKPKSSFNTQSALLILISIAAILALLGIFSYLLKFF